MYHMKKFTDVSLPSQSRIIKKDTEEKQPKEVKSIKEIEKVDLVETKYLKSGCNEFISIPYPEQFCYLDSTNKIDISVIPEFTNLEFVSDGIQTLSFSQQMQRLQVPNSWGAWAPPPFTESATPSLLFSNFETDVTIKLSIPSKVFGFELEPNIIGEPVNVEVRFYSEGELLGTISRVLTNDSFSDPEARLFAGVYSCKAFDRIEISIDNEEGFGIAQLRYGNGIDCRLWNTDKYIPFECNINTGFDVLDIGKPNLLGYNMDVNCKLGECYVEPKIKIGRKKLDCDLECVPVDILWIRGKAILLLSISALLEVDNPGNQIVNFTCTPYIEICQTCFDCEDEGSCGSGLLVLKRLGAYINGNNEISIKGIVKFICPGEVYDDEDDE